MKKKIVHGIAFSSALLTFSQAHAEPLATADIENKLSAMMQRIERLEAEQRALTGSNQALQQENARLKSVLTGGHTQIDAQNQKSGAPYAQADSRENSVAAPFPEIEPAAGADAGDLKVPGTETTLKLGGYIKVDAIEDIGSGHGGDFAAFHTVPLEGSVAAEKSADFHAHVRQTRLSLTSTTPTESGDIKGYLEADFYGTRGTDTATNGHNLQLRQAYIQYDNLLVGQTWTNFADMGAYPESLDYVGVVGVPLVRQVQAKYTTKIGEKGSLSGSLENPSADFINAGADTVVDGSKMPDATLAYSYSDDWGHITLGTLARNIEVENETDRDSHSEFGYGLALSGKVKVMEKDSLVARVAYGDGIGRYIYEVGGGSQGSAFNNDKLETQDAYAGYAGYQHYWRDDLRSNFMAGYVGIDNNTDMIGTARNESIWSSHANLLWQPYKKLRFGVEYMHGERSLENGSDGSLDRVMASAIYNLD